MTLDPERWRKIEELYHSAFEQPAEHRSSFLAQVCGHDPELQHEVEALLAQSGAQSNTAGLLDRPAWENAAGLLDETHTQFQPGAQLGPYRLLAKIGEGGMGDVYRAHDARLGRDVALKIATSRFSARFEREARAIAALSHPHICTLHDVGPNYLVMELLEGETLAARLRRGPLPVEEVLRYGDQMSDALSEAHRLGVVHRDLKPSNIFLTRNGVKVLDFGIAKTITDPGLTEPNVVMGTPAYMSPEQLQGKPADARTDLFSLGLVLYEMTSGALPFPGSSLGVLLNSVPTKVPSLIKAPTKLGSLIPRLLEKEPSARPQSALEVRDYIRKSAAGATVSRRAIAALVLLLLIGAGVFGTQAYLRRSRARWAQNEALPEVERLMRQSRWLAATDLLRRAQRYAPASPELIKLQDLVPPANVTIETEPAGADIYIRDYTSPDDDATWQRLGRSPVKTNRLPQSHYPRGYYVVRALKPGFETVQRAGPLGQTATPGTLTEKFELHSSASTPAGMVWVPPGSGATWLGFATPEPIPGFWIDRYEVTNRQFKEFVDHGGYRKREFWKEPFRRAGKTLTWEQATAEFQDATGRLGPSTWRIGSYPDGHADFPVGGVSWYEASAYAEFAGKSLPTAFHWFYAGDTGPFSDVLSFANFGGEGPAPVGKYRSLGPFGTFDMAGNVQEWVSTPSGDLRITLGGAWNTPRYMAMSTDARPPFERKPVFGFRCVRYESPVPDSLKGPLARPSRDRRNDKPVDDQTYKLFQKLLDYDRSDLKPTLDSVERGSYWRLENVSFQAAYNGERVSAHLYLPDNAAPPYQAVVLLGSSELQNQRTPYDDATASLTFGFLLRSGRAVLVPAYKGLMERGPMPGSPGPDQQREMLIAWSKDLRRSIDYLATRPDIDLNKLAFGAVSSSVAPFLVALEPRIKTVVIVSGGTSWKVAPEIDSWNYAPRVTIPALMINGRSDFGYPLESSQLPLFRALGTPAKDKKHVLFQGGHATPVAQPDLIKAYLDWLDQYLGPVQLRP